MPTPSQVSIDFLTAFTSGDMDAADARLTDDFTFHGPMMQTEGKAAFFEGVTGLAPIVRGFDLLQQWEDGDDVFTVYDFQVETPKGPGSVTMAEWHTIRDGQVASSRLLFDTAAFQALFPD